MDFGRRFHHPIDHIRGADETDVDVDHPKGGCSLQDDVPEAHIQTDAPINETGRIAQIDRHAQDGCPLIAQQFGIGHVLVFFTPGFDFAAEFPTQDGDEKHDGQTKDAGCPMKRVGLNHGGGNYVDIDQQGNGLMGEQGQEEVGADEVFQEKPFEGEEAVTDANQEKGQRIGFKAIQGDHHHKRQEKKKNQVLFRNCTPRIWTTFKQFLIDGFVLKFVENAHDEHKTKDCGHADERVEAEYGFLHSK